jgi:hypothetical protein
MFSVGTYSDFPFSDQGSLSVTVEVTGVVGTGQLGTASAGQFVTVVPTGVSASTTIGNVTIDAVFNVTDVVNGVSATISIGTYSVATQGNELVVTNGVAATGAIGTPATNFDSVITPTGQTATGEIGTVASNTSSIAKPRQNEDFVITVKSTASGNKYFVNGVQQQMPTALHKGFTYKFDQSDSSNNNHPMRFSTTNNGSWAGGSEYTDGVSVVGVPGQAGAYTQIVVASNAPSQLYTYCLNHSGMGFGVPIEANVNLLMTLSDGTVTVSEGVTIIPTGLTSQGLIGQITVGLGADVFPTGVSVTGSIGDILLWQEVNTSQDPNWTRIAA